jgi:hypothetical protein
VVNCRSSTFLSLHTFSAVFFILVNCISSWVVLFATFVFSAHFKVSSQVVWSHVALLVTHAWVSFNADVNFAWSKFSVLIWIHWLVLISLGLIRNVEAVLHRVVLCHYWLPIPFNASVLLFEFVWQFCIFKARPRVIVGELNTLGVVSLNSVGTHLLSYWSTSCSTITVH